MADSQFYIELAALDPGIANRWKKLTGDRLNVVINADGIVAVLRPVLDFRNPKTHRITKGQAEAIVKLLDGAKFSPGTKEATAEILLQAVELNYFIRGARSALETAAELKDVTTALGHGSVGAIKFFSPGSGLSYTANLYAGVLDLVGRKEIKVVEVHAAGLNECSRCTAARIQRGVGGHYDGASNEMVVYQGFAPDKKKLLIVHEATHAIQDWTDTSILHFHAEADAYIAAGAVALRMGPDVFKDNNRYGEALKAAVNAVKYGWAVADNTAWKEAYHDVVTAVSNDDLYKGKKGLRFNANEKKRAKGAEAVEWGKTLERIKQLQQGHTP
jgi:hypothetical protein